MNRLVKKLLPLVLATTSFSCGMYLFQDLELTSRLVQSESFASSSVEDSTSSAQSNATDEASIHLVQEPTRSAKGNFWNRRRPSLAYNKRLSPLVLGSFSEALGSSWKSAVRILHEEEQVALGTIVDREGWIITKASQLPDSQSVVCSLYDYRTLPAKVVTRVANLDLALLRVSAEDLPTPSWAETIPNRGSFVATADLKSTPTSLGVVSAGIQRVPYQRSVLGVHLTNSRDGAAVTHVLRGSGGERAGLRIGDNIYEVNGVSVNTHQGFKQAIRDAEGGEYVALRVSRGEKKLEMSAQLMDLADELLDDTEMEVNGDVSARSSNFERVLLHDTFLHPTECGGPLVNLDGEVIGINIARAGRVSSYALPFDVVLPVVDDLIRNAKLVSRSTETLGKANALR